MRHNAPDHRDNPSLADYLARRHLSVDAAIGHQQVEDALAPLGYHPEIAVRVAHFAAIPRLLETTPHLATVLSTVAG